MIWVIAGSLLASVGLWLMAAALGCYEAAVRERKAAEFERTEAAWLLAEAKRCRPEASRDDRIEYVGTLSRHADWSKMKS